jgi:hypothetical protein
LTGFTAPIPSLIDRALRKPKILGQMAVSGQGSDQGVKMRRALCLVLAFGLLACTPGAKAPDETSAKPSPVSVDAGGIEVTPLAAPGTTATTTTDASAAAASAPAAAAAQAPAPATDAVPVAVATADTPHPKARPTGLGTGTGTGTAAGTETPAAEETPPPKSGPQIQCEASGGLWGQSGGSGAFLCQKMTKDGGKVCHKKGDCSGECLAPSQTCSPVAPLMGCNDVMDAEGRQVTLCLD